MQYVKYSHTQKAASQILHDPEFSPLPQFGQIHSQFM